jgi:hypothetical protein
LEAEKSVVLLAKYVLNLASCDQLVSFVRYFLSYFGRFPPRRGLPPSVTAAPSFSNRPPVLALAADFFSAARAADVTRVLLEGLADNANLVELLVAALPPAAAATREFPDAGGLQWMRRALKGRSVSIAFFARVIVAITVTARFDVVDRFVAELPPDHPIFRLPPAETDGIVDGMNTCQHRPVRVHALLRPERPPSDDPYNN